MAQLVDVLAADLPPNLVHLNHVLTGVGDRGDHVALTFAAGDDIVAYQRTACRARRSAPVAGRAGPL